MKIKCGESEVIANGSVIAYRDNPVEMCFSMDGNDFLFRIFFSQDDLNESSRIDVKNISPSETEIYIVNSFTVFGIGSPEPLELGEVNGLPIRLAFRIYSISSSDEKLLHYTWLLG